MSESGNDDEGTGVLIALGMTVCLSVGWAYVVKDQEDLMTWGALLVSGVTGLVAGTYSKNSQTVAVVCALAAPLGAYLGTLLGLCLLAVAPYGGDFGDAWHVFSNNTGEMARVFKVEAQDRDWLFLFLSAPVGYGAAMLDD
ncbi:hypothetical protein SAMN05216483_6171 [Streptomyces sp. 2131.1]|uniref:hypothetical protein n=1 Tax=Streptomyces sp. 2131.1 TaxID=1855346 RepID=UPI000897E276|nr:hypothetical protein [Streptomyces sp. 2131.1]SEE42035.1 hypothetical protein SAMN05216483_6171 [Streptomyces sp. 2131.1]